ncbi:unnamed protein product [Cuscuta epithymum]|uniref:Uncharacterized protein n=1 Tax=Cuscuta epithymum TaxID=186058 RepID=A0AAV0FK04_9ASTE|nr:unnamed protein product [Cuscuta epithymum]
MEQLKVTVLFDGRWNTEKRVLAHSSHGLLLEADGSYSNLLFGLRDTTTFFDLILKERLFIYYGNADGKVEQQCGIAGRRRRDYVTVEWICRLLVKDIESFDVSDLKDFEIESFDTPCLWHKRTIPFLRDLLYNLGRD